MDKEKGMELQTFGVHSESSDRLRLQLNNQDLGNGTESVNSNANFQFNDNASTISDNVSTTSTSRRRDHSPSRIKKLTINSPIKHFHLPHIHLPHLHLPHLPHPHLPHLPSHHSIQNMTGKIFHGKGLKKLRTLSKRRRHRKRSKGFAKRRKVNRWLNTNWAMALMIISTLFLIYIDDFMVATGAPDSTASYAAISALKIAVFLVFLVEMAAQIFVQRLHYIISFFFVIDLIAIASLIPDIIGFIFGIKSIVHAINALSLGRTARVARIASRLSRIARIINFFNIGTNARKSIADDNDGKLQIATEPSSIGKKVLAKSTHKVVVMVLILVLITSLTSVDLSGNDAYTSTLTLFSQSATINGLNSASFNATVTNYLAAPDRLPLLQLIVQDSVIYDAHIDTSNWFSGYIIKIDANNQKDVLWVNNKHNEQVTAALGITLTTSVIIVLCLGTLLMSRDFQILVIKPIERMVSLIKKISAMDRYDGASDRDSDVDTDEDYGTDPESGENYDTSAMDSGNESESIGGFDDEPETNIIVELLSDIAHRKGEIRSKERAVHEVHAQVTHGIHALASAASAFMARKRFKEECKMYKRRAHIVHEIMTTEQTFVASLGLAIEAYLMPLRSNSLLPLETLNIIFGNIEVLHQYHQDFIVQLEERVGSWSLNSRIGDIFVTLETGIVDIYSTYVNNYNNVMKEVESARHDEKVAIFLNEQRETRCKGSDILAYLIMPVQRMPRYVLLLEDLLKHTPSSHFDYEAIASSTRALKRATVVLNERKREAENKHAVQDIYMQLVPPLPDILLPGNCVFFQNKLKQDGDKFVFILLASGLIKATKSGSELHVKQYYTIKDLQCTIIQDCPNIKVVNAFQLRIDETTSHLLIAKTPELRQTCLDAIAQFNKIHTARTKSMQFINHTKRSSGRGSISSPSPHRSSISSSNSLAVPSPTTSKSNLATNLLTQSNISNYSSTSSSNLINK